MKIRVKSRLVKVAKVNPMKGVTGTIYQMNESYKSKGQKEAPWSWHLVQPKDIKKNLLGRYAIQNSGSPDGYWWLSGGGDTRKQAERGLARAAGKLYGKLVTHYALLNAKRQPAGNIDF